MTETPVMPSGVVIQRPANVRFGSKAEVKTLHFDVCFTPESDIGCVFSDVRFGPKADIVPFAKMHFTRMSCCLRGSAICHPNYAAIKKPIARLGIMGR
jgi:hypothetical protein